jgi:hypothetical protein
MLNPPTSKTVLLFWVIKCQITTQNLPNELITRIVAYPAKPNYVCSYN